MEHVQEGWNVMLIWVASRLTVFSEEGKILGVRDYIHSKKTIEFKPLRAFTPVSKLNMRKHAATVATAAIAGGIIVGFNKAVGGVSEISVDSGEVVDWDAALGKQNKPLIGEVQQSICQKPSLSLCQRHCAPRNILAGDLAPVERGRLRDVEMESRRGVDVNAEERGVAVEESLPEGQHGKGTPGEKHEGHLGDSAERVLFFLRHQGSPPEELIVRQSMSEVGRMKEVPHVERRRRRRGRWWWWW